MIFTAYVAALRTVIEHHPSAPISTFIAAGPMHANLTGQTIDPHSMQQVSTRMTLTDALFSWGFGNRSHCPPFPVVNSERGTIDESSRNNDRIATVASGHRSGGRQSAITSYAQNKNIRASSSKQCVFKFVSNICYKTNENDHLHQNNLKPIPKFGLHSL